MVKLLNKLADLPIEKLVTILLIFLVVMIIKIIELAF